MFDYLSFIHSGKSKPSGNARKDGSDLAAQCIKKIKADQERFPPQLLILLASPAYLEKQKAEELLNGINSTFRKTFGKVPLIGCSVAGVFFDRKVHPEGALLVCLGSKLLSTQVAYGVNARRSPKGATDELLRKLDLHPAKLTDPNPLANRLLIAFMPGFVQNASQSGLYPAPELHRLLHKGLQSRIRIVGGVSSANDPTRKKDGFQFVNGKVLKDAVAAASITTGVPIGVSLADGLISKKKIVQVTKLAADKRRVLEFDAVGADELLKSIGSTVVLRRIDDDTRIEDLPLSATDGSVQLLMPVERGAYFKVLKPAKPISRPLLDAIDQANKEARILSSIATLLFVSRVHSPATPQEAVTIARALSRIESSSRDGSGEIKPCVGGFFDGEIGVDDRGTSRFTNGHLSCVIFGDEIRERTPLYRGVSALADYGPRLLAGADLTPASINETIRNALSLVTETGFPGAMLSLVISNLDRQLGEKKRYIIAIETIGPRFTEIKEHTKRLVDGEDVLASVTRTKESRFIPDSRKDRSCNQEAIKLSGIISQYVLPMKRLDRTVFGTLQVDLGDLSPQSPDAFRRSEKARILECFAEVISATINRVATAVENAIVLKLEQSLAVGLMANSVHEGVDKFFKSAGAAFGVEMGCLRLIKNTDEGAHALVLETGFGAGYEAEKQSRHAIGASEVSPISQAFAATEPQIVNDITSDPVFQTLLLNSRDDEELYEPLGRIRSYGAVSVLNEAGKLVGALTLSSTQPWFFLELHRTALTALAERLGFLIQHLNAKIARNFLLAVNPRLAQRNLNDSRRILGNITNDFRRALNAEVSSLYLWDADIEKYVLRAQSNWKDGNWVDAAKYATNSGWLGDGAISKKALYVADLRKYYAENAYEFPNGRYAKYMFGESLSEAFTVEAIGLPLRIGPEKTNKFGVLMLYRRVRKGESTGFVTTDVNLLQEGADNAAGLINAVLWHRADKLEKLEQTRRNQIYQEISTADDRTIESKVCQAVLKTFRAVEVDFYRVNERDSILEPAWMAGALRKGNKAKIEKRHKPSGYHDDLIRDTVGSDSPIRPYRVATRRRKLAEDASANSSAMKTQDLIEQVCVPLIGDRKYVGALVIRWQIGVTDWFGHRQLHDDSDLQILGRIVGSLYSKHQMKKSTERSKQAVQTAGLYVFQHAHRLGNALQTLYRIANRIQLAPDEEQRNIRIKELETTAENKMAQLDWIFDLGELMQNPIREKVSLQSLLRECWQEIASSQSVVKVNLFEEQLNALADRKLLKEVFINLMTNAEQAMRRKKATMPNFRSRLTVTAAVSEDKETVRITFKDNGAGMTRQQLGSAVKGFSSSERPFGNVRHKGVGVLISRYLLGVQDGYLDFVSKRGKGTEAIVTLPNFRDERRRDEVAR